MKQRTLEEEWEYYKGLEREGINPFKHAGEACKDCTNCISVCEKRKNASTTVKVVNDDITTHKGNIAN